MAKAIQKRSKSKLAISSAQVKLRLGNLFDGPTDLIVLPCSTGGTISSFVANSLNSYNLPLPPKQLKLGTISVREFPGGENIAQFVAYAASVQGMASNEETINQIGKALGVFTVKEPAVRAISAPLLGSGAGGLNNETAANALKTGFLSTASPGAILTISVINQSAYNVLSEQRSSLPSTPRSPRVFISYTFTDEKHLEWVKNLGTYLRSNGVEARLDQWHLKPGMDLPQWMANELNLADRVIIVSNEKYADKADGRLGGVGWETMLIQGNMMSKNAASNKYLIIVRAKDFSAGTPQYLKTKYAFHWHSKAKENAMRENLLKELYEISSAPPLGAPPVFL